MPEWLWALAIGAVVLGLVTTVWRMHETHDKERNEHIWDQIGRDSRSGMREILHKCANALTRLRDVERRVGRLERHTKVDTREDDE
jgi:hypothetical protein